MPRHNNDMYLDRIGESWGKMYYNPADDASEDIMADSRSYARDAEDRIEEEDELEEGDWDALDSDDLEDEYDPDDLD